MATQELNFIIRATNLTDKAFTDIENRLKGFSKSFEDTAKGFRQFGAGITGAGVALGGLLVHTGLVAARTETLGVAMEAVAKSTGTSIDVLKEQEKILKKQGITTQEARSTLTKFMQSQLDVADASKIARVAQDLAVISGENSSETTARLTDAIATMNPMLLRQVGIVKNTGEVFDAYAETLGKSGTELTEVEKKQALLNLILKEGEKVAGTYEAAMGTAGKQLASLERWIEEAKNAFGEAFLPVIAKVVEVTTSLLKSFMELSPETKKMITYIVMGAAAFALLLGPLLLLIGFLPAIAAGFAILLGPVGWVILAVTALIAIGTLLILKWKEIKNFFQLTWEGIKIYFEEGKIKVEEVVRMIIDSWNNFKNAFSIGVDIVAGKALELWGKIRNYVIGIVGAITGLFLPAIIKMAIVTGIEFAKIAGYWLVMQAQAIATSVIHAIQIFPSIVAGFIGMAIQAAISVAGIIAGWIAMGIQATITAIEVVAAWVIMAIQATANAIRMAAAWIIAMGPIAWVSAIVIALVALIISNWNKVLEKTQEVWKALGQFFIDIWEDIKGTFSSAIDWLMEKLQPLLNAIDRVKEGASIASSGWQTVVGGVKGALGVKDAIITPQGKVIQTDPADWLIATKNPGALAGGGITVNINGGYFLSETVATDIGDQIIQRLKRTMQL